LARKRRKSGPTGRPVKGPGGETPAARTPDPSPRDSEPKRRRRIVIAGALAGLAILVSALAVWWPAVGPFRSLFGQLRFDSATAPAFVGSETCAGCHQEQAQLWGASQHKHAMQHATDKTVLGDFNDASFDYYDVRSRFFRQGGKFLVETDGPDGKLATSR
jgi:hypothetical protein